MLRVYDEVLWVIVALRAALAEIEKRDSDLARQMRRAAASVALKLFERELELGIEPGRVARIGQKGQAKWGDDDLDPAEKATDRVREAHGGSCIMVLPKTVPNLAEPLRALQRAVQQYATQMPRRPTSIIRRRWPALARRSRRSTRSAPTRRAVQKGMRRRRPSRRPIRCPL